MNVLIKYIYVLYFIFFNLLNISSQDILQNKIDSIYDLLNSSSEPIAKAEFYIQLSDLYLNLDQNQSFIYANKGQEIGLSLNDAEIIIKSELAKVNILINLFKYTDVFQILDEIEVIAKENNKFLYLAKVNSYRGKTFAKLNNYNKALEYSFISLGMYEKIRNKAGITKQYENIGEILLYLKRYDEAMIYAKKALQNYRNQNNKTGEADMLSNIAILFRRTGQLEMASKFLLESVNIYSKINDKIGVGNAYMTLHRVSIALKDTAQALKYLEESVIIFSKLNEEGFLARSYVNYANYYFNISNFSIAIEYAIKSYNIGKKLNDKNTIFYATDILHKLYMKLGDFSKAYDYFNEFKTISDSFNFNNSKVDFDISKMNFYVSKIEREKEVAKTKIYYRNFTIITSLSLITFVFLFLLSKESNRIKKLFGRIGLLKEGVYNKKALLTSFFLQDLKKLEVLNNIFLKLKYIRPYILNQKIDIPIDEIIGKIENVVNDKSYEKFISSFEEIFSDFFIKLSKLHPDLSPNEIRLCALLKLNLSTKEISEITGQKLETLNIARFRLRKKIGIDNENLVIYLSKI